MAERFQLAQADGNQNFGPGKPSFAASWDIASDLLRFHRGAGWRLKVDHTAAGPVIKFSDVRDRAESVLNNHPDDTVLRVSSEKDHYTLLMRRHTQEVTGADIVLARILELVGTPYVFGVTDCSWLSMQGAAEVGVDLPHNAHAQHLLTSVVRPITRSHVKPFDLLFHHSDDHVSWYAGEWQGFDTVFDTEPHSTGAPAGWPTAETGTGVRRRPMNPGYYTDWADVNGIGRIVPINGPVS